MTGHLNQQWKWRLKMGLENRQHLFHALAVSLYLIVDLNITILGLTILFTRWDLLFHQWGAGIQYLSLWNLVILQGYFMLSLYHDVTSMTSSNHRLFHKLLCLLFYNLVLPLSCIVSMDFWFFYKMDPGLVDPFDCVQEIMPNLNHFFHSFIVPIVLVEIFVSDRPIKYANYWLTFIAVTLVQMAYTFVCYVCNYFGDVWPYPLLEKLSFVQHIGTVLINSLFGVLCLFLTKIIRNMNYALILK